MNSASPSSRPSLRAFNPTDAACEYVYDQMVCHSFSMDDAAKAAGPSGIQRWALNPASVLFEVRLPDVATPAGLIGSINVLPGRHADVQIHLWHPAAMGRQADPYLGLFAMAYAFREFALVRLNAFIAEPNTLARRYATRMGFTEEGRARRAFLHAGTLHTGIAYGILREEAIQRFEAALAPNRQSSSTITDIEDLVTTKIEDLVTTTMDG